ncbi:MAG: hypothetical protein NTX03_12175 [Bacteroidetes bacterium]|nr:hypothetical protein [Bacteroidota bacterium]
MRNLLFVLLYTLIFFAITMATYPVAVGYDAGTITNKYLGAFCTDVFMLLNFPVWILAKGSWVFEVKGMELYGTLLLNNFAYGLVAYFALFRKKKVEKVVRKGNE